MPELLSPAGNFEKLKAAIRYGADAVYCAGQMFGMRAAAGNFTLEELAEAAEYVHARGRRMHITVNVMARDADYPRLRDYLCALREVKPDALIVADLGVMAEVRRILPDVELHVSTQASVVSAAACAAYASLGASRIVLARELMLDEIKRIRANLDPAIALETFIHGSMCISYSGRCGLSYALTGRDANRGECTHPCRWNYALMEETRPGEYFPVMENERGTYIMNSKDLCMIGHIPDLIAAGIDSFKVEGRMKTALYVATVARTYRKAIDDCLEDPALYERNMDWYNGQISSCTYRQFTTGFFYGKPGEDAQIYDSNTYTKNYTYLGTASQAEGCFCRISQRNKFSVGEDIEIMKPDGRNVCARVLSIRAEDGTLMESAPHPQQMLTVELSEEIQEQDLIRRKETDPEKV